MKYNLCFILCNFLSSKDNVHMYVHLITWSDVLLIISDKSHVMHENIHSVFTHS